MLAEFRWSFLEHKAFRILCVTILMAFFFNLVIVTVPPGRTYFHLLCFSFEDVIVFLSNSFMQKLKDDARLSNSMGQEGRKAMSGRTISAVVGDLLVWYQKGQQNCQKRKFKAYVGISLLAIVVPLSVAAFFIYDLLVFENIPFFHNILDFFFILLDKCGHASFCLLQYSQR